MPSLINQVLYLSIGPAAETLQFVYINSSFVCVPTGSTITAEIQGVIDACVKLTGMPDLTLSFMVGLPPL